MNTAIWWKGCGFLRKILEMWNTEVYNPVFDSWIKERNAEVIGITSSQRFSSENRNMVILSPFAFLLYFPHFLFRDEF